MSFTQESVVPAEVNKTPKKEVLDLPSAEAQRNHEVMQRVSRAQSFMDKQASRMEDYLLEAGDDAAAGQLSAWFREKRANFKKSTQGLMTPDPELAAFTLMAGLATERHREVARNPDLDETVAREATAASKLSGAIFAQEMSGKMLGDTKVSIKNPNSLADIVRLTQDASRLPAGFGATGLAMSVLQEGLRGLHAGKGSEAHLLKQVESVLNSFNDNELSLMANLEKLANPKTAPAERALIVVGMERLNKTIVTLQAMRDQLESAVYLKGAEDSTARAKIDELRAHLEQKTSTASASTKPLETRPAIPELPVEYIPSKNHDLTPANPLFKSLVEAKTPAEAKAMLTPEMKRIGLEFFLHELDDRLATAKRVHTPGSVLPAASLIDIFGPGIQGNKGVVFQRFVAAAGQPIPDLPTLAKMNVRDFAKKVLGYDLDADVRRADVMRTYTNLFWEKK